LFNVISGDVKVGLIESNKLFRRRIRQKGSYSTEKHDNKPVLAGLGASSLSTRGAPCSFYSQSKFQLSFEKRKKIEKGVKEKEERKCTG